MSKMDDLHHALEHLSEPFVASVRAARTAFRRGWSVSMAVGIIVTFLLPGCTFIKLRKDLSQMATHGELWGQVSNLPSSGTSTYILIFRDDPLSSQLVDWERVRADGDYSVLVPSGVDFEIVAFADLNGNRRWDPGEPSDLAKRINVSPVINEGRMQAVSFSLKTGRSIPDSLRVAVPGDITLEHTSSTVVLGDVVSLDEPRFSADTGHEGLWDPYKFLEHNGTGIFFVEPYDLNRIPVLFIYGAGGSPQDWRYIIENMDRSRFQAWFFHYPTGIRLESLSLGLNSLVQRLHETLQFEKLFVVAHSMGGLVARDFILRNTEDGRHSYIRRLVTISTPWEGHNAASAGARLSPVVVPSWNDLRPGGSFLSSLFGRKLPPEVGYYLIFGFRHTTRPWLPPDNDGVVGLASELSLPAQYEARRVFGLNLDHDAILKSAEVLRKLEDFLSE